MTKEIRKSEGPADPWTEIDHAFDAIRRGFAESLGISPFGGFGPQGVVRSPRTDVTDTGKGYKVVADIPGIPKEQLHIRVRGTVVEIRAESTTETEEKEEQYLHHERTYSGYYRALELPEPVVATEAKAKLTNGVLELELPKQHPTPSEKEVEIAVA